MAASAATTPADVPITPARPRVGFIFAALMLVLLLAALDSTIVATALPTIVGELGGLRHLAWVTSAFLLAQTVVTPVYGKLGDLYGRKRILLVPLYGHTRGHTGVAVEHDGRWLLHCGDAFFNRGELESPPRCPPAMRAFQNVNSVDNAARKQNSERLRELAQQHAGEVELFNAHDPVMLARHQQASAPAG